MINYPSLHDELEKIAKEKERFITKEKFKRHLKTVVPTGVGVGLGVASMKAVERAIEKNPQMLKKIPPSVIKKAPWIAGALGGAGMLAGALHRRKVNKYIDEGK